MPLKPQTPTIDNERPPLDTTTKYIYNKKRLKGETLKDFVIFLNAAVLATRSILTEIFITKLLIWLLRGLGLKMMQFFTFCLFTTSMALSINLLVASGLEEVSSSLSLTQSRYGKDLQKLPGELKRSHLSSPMKTVKNMSRENQLCLWQFQLYMLKCSK